jgi:hypothetical protein
MMSRFSAFFVTLLLLGGTPEPASTQAQGCRFNCGGQPISRNAVQDTQALPTNPSACPPGTIFRRETGRCVFPQDYGGVIPCSEDDKRFVPGRGWVSNCR